MTRSNVFRNVISLVIFGVYMILAIGSTNSSSPSQTFNVQYRITGTATSVDITISTPGDSTEQRSVSIPYTSPTYTFKGWSSAYLSAQNKGEYGSVTVEIVSNGTTIKSATSSGAYMIASASWLVGSKD